jgi:hypothetical protein
MSSWHVCYFCACFQAVCWLFLLLYMSDWCWCNTFYPPPDCKLFSWLHCHYTAHHRHLAFICRKSVHAYLVQYHDHLTFISFPAECVWFFTLCTLLTIDILCNISGCKPVSTKSYSVFMPIDWTITPHQLVCCDHISHSTDLTPYLGCVYFVWTLLHPADDLCYPHSLFTRQWDSQSLFLYQYVWHTCFNST